MLIGAGLPSLGARDGPVTNFGRGRVRIEGGGAFEHENGGGVGVGTVSDRHWSGVGGSLCLLA